MNDHCVQCINLGLQYQRNVDQSVTGCINLALVADEQVRN